MCCVGVLSCRIADLLDRSVVVLVLRCCVVLCCLFEGLLDCLLVCLFCVFDCWFVRVAVLLFFCCCCAVVLMCGWIVIVLFVVL